MRGILAFVLGFFVLTPAVFADEFRLKDGTKLVGTIVGFEGDSFKVETSYGFALVRKDKIAAIIPSEPKKEAAAETKRTAAAENKKSATPAPENKSPTPPAMATAAPVAAAPVETSAAAPASAPVPASAATKETTRSRVAAKKKSSASPADAAKAETPSTAATPSASTTSPANGPNAPSAEKPASVAAASPSAAPQPAEPVNQEEVQGNLYINHTYGFRIYKPPGWHVIEGAQQALPTAIVAMGTGDETTLLVVGHERMKDSLEAHAAATERQLREVYENYRRLSEQRNKVAGLPALARRYRGTADGHDWSGVLLSIARGNEVFTILGMTYADSDLIQIQENVITKTIASLEFTAH